MKGGGGCCRHVPEMSQTLARSTISVLARTHAVVPERHAEPHHEKLESESSVMPGEHVFDFSLLLLKEKDV